MYRKGNEHAQGRDTDDKGCPKMVGAIKRNAALAGTDAATSALAFGGYRQPEIGGDNGSVDGGGGNGGIWGGSDDRDASPALEGSCGGDDSDIRGATLLKSFSWKSRVTAMGVARKVVRAENVAAVMWRRPWKW